MVAAELLSEIKRIVREETPFGGLISDVDFEGPRVVLYCENLDLLMENGEAIKELAHRIHKRIVLRPAPGILSDPEEAEQRIKELVPPGAEITNLIFSKEIGEVTIEAKKPGVVIGKEGALLREMMRRIRWTPRVVRTPPIQSDLVQSIRLSLIQASAERREILRKIGRRIHRESKARSDWVRISTLGGSREVGRSCFVLQTPESRVMLDCGTNVASVDRAFPHLEVPEVRLPEIDALIVSHAHLDHIGFLPYLFKYGYEGPVYCTPPTRDLAVLLQQDYVEIAEREDKPLPYDRKDIRTFVRHCIPLDFGDVTDISPDIKITFHNAGHILGSSVVHLHVGEGLHNIVYTGDVKFDRTRLFSPAVYTFPRVETLILDSTYGGSDDIMPPRAEAEREFLRVVRETMEGGGKVLIPAFAVGRAQEVMVLLEDCRRKGLFEGQVYLEGMIWEAMGIHTAYPEYLSADLRRQIFQADLNPFLSDMFVRVTNADQRAQVIESSEPAVIVSTAGMMAGGPVIEYFKRLAQDPRNALIFVGYQCEGSLGRRIQKGWHEVPLRAPNGKLKEVRVNMRVKTTEGFSGHSDRMQLLNYVRRLTPRPARIICCHGDGDKCVSLASSLHKLFRVETRAPLNLETIRLR